MSTSPEKQVVAKEEEEKKEQTEIPGPSVHIHSECPQGKTILRILLVSGHKTDMICNPQDTVTQFTTQVYENWPLEWKKDKSINSPEAVQNVKLLHRGKFPDPATTLESNGFNAGLITVCHILVKNQVGDQAQQRDSGKKDSERSGCRCLIL